MNYHVESRVSAQRVEVLFEKGQKQAEWIGGLMHGDVDKAGSVLGSLASTSCGNLHCCLWVGTFPDEAFGLGLSVKVLIPEGANQAGAVGVTILTPGEARWEPYVLGHSR
jgi:hypothetical protein